MEMEESHVYILTRRKRKSVEDEILIKITNSVLDFLEFTGEVSTPEVPVPFLDTQLWVTTWDLYFSHFMDNIVFKPFPIILQ